MKWNSPKDKSIFTLFSYFWDRNSEYHVVIIIQLKSYNFEPSYPSINFKILKLYLEKSSLNHSGLKCLSLGFKRYLQPIIINDDLHR